MGLLIYEPDAADHSPPQVLMRYVESQVYQRRWRT